VLGLREAQGGERMLSARRVVARSRRARLSAVVHTEPAINRPAARKFRITLQISCSRCRRGDRASVTLTRLLRAECGTKRTYRDSLLFVRFRGQSALEV
jgi:hypothetical protein